MENTAIVAHRAHDLGNPVENRSSRFRLMFPNHLPFFIQVPESCCESWQLWENLQLDCVDKNRTLYLRNTLVMKCPVCKTVSLQTIDLESHLRAHHCPQCDGIWIAATDYEQWLEHHGDRLPEKEPDGIPIQADDHQQAKLCPDCKQIMLRYKVGHGLNFRLDQCGSCNGVWFDANEWEALKQRNLHDEVHLMFSAHWQAQVRQDEARQTLERVYTTTFKADYDKIKDFKAWLDEFPEREAVLDYVASLDPYSLKQN